MHTQEAHDGFQTYRSQMIELENYTFLQAEIQWNLNARDTYDIANTTAIDKKTDMSTINTWTRRTPY